jgi:WD40 repeat protein
MSEQGSNPYVGPRTFARDESHLFFGREREARDLLSLVISERLVLFYAQSGAGKSSLINTRLIPGLEAQGFEVLPVGRVGGALSPEGKAGNVFIYNLLLSVGQKEGRPGPAPSPNATIKGFLREYRLGEIQVDRGSSEDEDRDYEASPRALIVDQLEEIFTSNLPDWQKRQDFFSQLYEAIKDDDHLWVILVMREDYVAGLQPYVHLLPGKLRARYHMQRMGFDAALRAVQGPVRDRRPFAEGVAEKLVDNLRRVRILEQEGERAYVSGEFVEPVQLQVVCYQLWENLRDQAGAEITGEDLQRLAGSADLAYFVDSALAQCYERAIARVAQDTPGRTEFDLRAWFEDRLITRARTRALVHQERTKTGGMDNDLVRELENAFLLRSESRVDSRWYELVHDRFIDPILQANADWRREHPLIQDALEWERTGKPESKLYLGPQLEAAFDHRDAGIGLVQAFLQAGREAEERRESAIRAEEERKRRELAIRAEEQKKRAEVQARAARRLGWLAAVLAVVFLLAAGAAVAARIQQRRAQTNEREANDARSTAVANEQLAATRAADQAAAKSTAEMNEQEARVARLTAVANEQLAATRAAEEAVARSTAVASEQRAATAAAEAVTARRTAEAERDLSNARKLAAVSISQLEVDPERSVLLALEAARTTYAEDGTVTQAAEDALHRAVMASRVEIVLSGHKSPVFRVAFSSDGERLATGSWRTVTVWDAASGKQLHAFATSSNQPWDIALSSDGRYLAAAVGRQVVVWDVAGSQMLFTKGFADSVWAVAFSPDGERLAVGGEAEAGGMVELLDTDTGKEQLTLSGHPDTVWDIAFSPDGTRIVTALGDGTAKVWDASTGQDLLILFDHGDDDDILSVAFSPDGASLATASWKMAKVWDVESQEERYALEDHTDWIYTVTFSPDGTLLATASLDGTARVWDAATGQELFSFDHADRVLDVAFSPDGARLVTAGEEGLARVWDLHRSQELFTIPGSSIWVKSIAFSPDGTRIATASNDRTARVWDAHSGEELLVLSEHTNFVEDVAFSPDGTKLATASSDNTAKVWDAATGQELLTFFGHSGDVNSIAFSPDGTRVVTGSADETAKVWDAVTASEVLTLSGHTGEVHDVAFSPDGTHIATAGEDKAARVWDADTGRELLLLSGHGYEVFGVAFSPDGTRLVTGSRDMTAKVWDAASGKELLTFSGHTNTVFDIDFWGTRVATASADGTAKVWDIATGKELYTLSGHTGLVHGVAFSPECASPPGAPAERCGKRLATASYDGSARVWNVSDSQELTTLPGHDRWINNIAFSPDGTQLATGSGNRTARVWDIASGQATYVFTESHGIGGIAFSPDGKRLATASSVTVGIWDLATVHNLLQFAGHDLWINNIAFSPDGTRLATASNDDTAKVWDAATGDRLLTLAGHTGDVRDIAFSPDGTRLATASGDGSARVWDAETGDLLYSLFGHSWRVFGVAFGPDGMLLATASEDGTAKVWDVTTGQEVRTLYGHIDTVWDVVFSPDGTRLVTASFDRTVRVWDPATGQALLTLPEHAARVYGVAVSPDGTRLASADEDGTVRICLLDIEELMALACSRVTRNLTEAEWETYMGADVPYRKTCPNLPAPDSIPGR